MAGVVFKGATRVLPTVSKGSGAASTAVRSTATSSAPARAMSSAPRNALPGKALGTLKQTALDAAKMTPQGQGVQLAADLFKAGKQLRSGESVKNVATGFVKDRVEGAVTDAVGAGGASLLQSVASKATGGAHNPDQPKHHKNGDIDRSL